MKCPLDVRDLHGRGPAVGDEETPGAVRSRASGTPVNPFLALTDKNWFDFLSSIADSGRVDEVNFWSPKAQRPMKQMQPGEPVFLRLKSPHHAIAGYGFFAHFSLLELDLAWDTFGAKNGAPTRELFLRRLGAYRGAGARDPALFATKLGCTILRGVAFWPKTRWIPWGEAEGWHSNIVQGKSESDPARASRLIAELAHDAVAAPEDLAQQFELLDSDERQFAAARTHLREGQGAFRTRLLDAYGRRCAITGERTEPVLDAAHIQPYLGPRSSHIQNGLLLTKEFHALFDKGLVTVTPDLHVRVSPAIRERWTNGRRYYEHDGRRLAVLPRDPAHEPSRAALRWHNEHRFERGSVA
jgi:putative restriction endonuclease